MVRLKQQLSSPYTERVRSAEGVMKYELSPIHLSPVHSDHQVTGLPSLDLMGKCMLSFLSVPKHKQNDI